MMRGHLHLVALILTAAPILAEDKTSGDWKYSLNENGTGTIVAYAGDEADVVVPAELDGVKITHIGRGAFALPANFSGADNLTSVVLPEGLLEIGGGAFERRAKLTNAVIPKSVELIEFSAFGNCSALLSVEVNPENPAYSSVDGVVFDKAEKALFHYPIGKPEKMYTIPPWIEVIGDCAFVKAKNLTEVIIPEGVRVIGLRAFDEASNLQNIVIPSSVESIRENAFYGCASLTNISVPTNSQSFASVDGVLFDKEKKVLWQYPAAKGGEYTVPDGVTKIGKFAFQGASNLQSVLIPASLAETADDNVFLGCASLKSISVATNNPAFASVDGVLFDKDRKLLLRYPAAKPGDYSVPDGVAVIGEHAFAYASNLHALLIPPSVTSIGHAFFECASLTNISVATNNPAFASVDGVLLDKEKKVLYKFPAGKSGEYYIPSGVTTIGASAFQGSKLTNVIVPKTVTSISKWAFSRSALTSAALPDSLWASADTYGFSDELAENLKAQAPPSADKADAGAPPRTNKTSEPSGLPSLSVGGVIYRNASLKKEYPLSLFIHHDDGTAFIKRNQLSKEQLIELAGTSGN
jgi:hypothetical protein